MPGNARTAITASTVAKFRAGCPAFMAIIVQPQAFLTPASAAAYGGVTAWRLAMTPRSPVGTTSHELLASEQWSTPQDVSMEQHPRLLVSETAVHLVEVLEVGRCRIELFAGGMTACESHDLPTPAG